MGIFCSCGVLCTGYILCVVYTIENYSVIGHILFMRCTLYRIYSICGVHYRELFCHWAYSVYAVYFVQDIFCLWCKLYRELFCYWAYSVYAVYFVQDIFCLWCTLYRELLSLSIFCSCGVLCTGYILFVVYTL